MNKPEMETLANCVKFHWGESDGFLTATVSAIHTHRDGHTSGEIEITTTAPGFKPHIVSDTLNLSSKLVRGRLAKELAIKYNHVDWDDILEYVCVSTIRHIRQGEPVEELLRTDKDVKVQSYALRPMLPLNQPTVLFGDGGSCKGWTALLLANCLRGFYDDNPFGFNRGEFVGKILYLDYETERDELLTRQECLCAGLELPEYPPILYRRQYIPFADDISRVQSLVLETAANVLIIDSVGAACAAELNSSETALRFFSALRSLKNVTCILIAHTSKNDEGKKTPYGSAYFKNYARSVWEVRKSQDTNSDTVDVGLFHLKANNSRLNSPIGIQFEFRSDDDDVLQSVQVKPEDAKTIAEFLDRMSLKIQIFQALGRGTMMTAKELAGATGSKEASVRRTLERYSTILSKIASPGNDSKWGLKS